MVSPAVAYAAAAMGYLAFREAGSMRVQDLADAIGAPPPYLSKIIHLLARKRFLETVKGTGGGVTLGVDPRKVTLYDLCEALDDDIVHPRCALGIAECSDERACPAHDLQTSVRAQQLAFLKGTTIQKIGEFNAGRQQAAPAAKNPEASVKSKQKGARP